MYMCIFKVIGNANNADIAADWAEVASLLNSESV
jgi:hypothetical protein